MGIVIYFAACGIILPIIVIYALIRLVRWFDDAADECEMVLKETGEFIRELEDMHRDRKGW